MFRTTPRSDLILFGWRTGPQAGNLCFNRLEYRLRRIPREGFRNIFLDFLVGEPSNVKRTRFELRYEVAVSDDIDYRLKDTHR